MSQSATSCLSQPVFDDGGSLTGAAKKNKIDLSDYDYRRDIENRLLMATFTPFDIEVLDEVLLSSLTLSATGLASDLGCSLSDLDSSLAKLEKAALLQRDGDRLVVDKEMRKYYEFQFLKFDDAFEPNMEFLQGLLRNVPIHILPTWYAIPRTSSNIFESLLERFLATPRLFQRYLLELHLEDPIQRAISDRVFASPELKVSSNELREEFDLSAEAFIEHMLHLEFNFICCVSYNREGDLWKEVVTPFHEWRQFLLFRQETMPVSVAEDKTVHQLRDASFAVAADMGAILKSLEASPISASRVDGTYLYEVCEKLLDHLATVCELDKALVQEQAIALSTYFGQLLGKLNLIEFIDEQLQPTTAGQEWLMLDLEERSIALYRHPFNTIITREISPLLNSEHNFREIERTLERAAHLGWVEVEDFLRGVIAPIGSAKEVTLERKGKRWRYQLPTYTHEERELIRGAILERFFEGGFVDVGAVEGSLCFRVTAFGRAVIAGGSTGS